MMPPDTAHPTNTAWQPPAGYIPVESRLAGVTVFAPAPKVETGPDALIFTCPRCGAATAYDPGAASVTCGSCGTPQYFQAQVVGRALSQAARLSTTEARSGAAPMRPRRMVGQASFLRWDGDWPFSPGVRARRAAAMEST